MKTYEVYVHRQSNGQMISRFVAMWDRKEILEQISFLQEVRHENTFIILLEITQTEMDSDLYELNLRRINERD